MLRRRKVDYHIFHIYTSGSAYPCACIVFAVDARVFVFRDFSTKSHTSILGSFAQIDQIDQIDHLACRYELSCRICTVQIQLEKHVPDNAHNADDTSPTLKKHELD